ncbi:DUF445 domain-containing protein [Pelagicoccus sp. NFK12]|uniref:DUF445 domain-containing protein n=1 Tax=Pelagicoccus enzymogenes TaxID=2773457 RepID=A0A927F7F3_9BACT|nr:DUF445 domain-containing protein [Pelagicoccus enzymogenes]MBD5779254.1 DUF445 domain-containing protein [Pelagicoccus enzymogenes]MDQ8198394.1 hypothetical protein [Pelagicoccus enzymogenes]
MNKSLVTNLIAVALLILGAALPDSAAKPFVLNAGVFALAGAVTNWIAVHMLFEKVPGLYGSGVIAARFEEFKAAIHKLVMESFFTEENFMKFADTALHQGLDAETLEKSIDMDELFEGFLQVVAHSKFGGMLSMFGGAKVLEPLRDPFKEEFRKRLKQIVDSLDISQSHSSFEKVQPMIEGLVRGKLDELTAPQVKQILSDLIREHLGWLVVWGGVFGALIGLLSTSLQTAFL